MPVVAFIDNSGSRRHSAVCRSCYKMNKSSKPWSTAQQICELSSIGAHLVDIQNEEEHIFISSYLQTVNQIIMLWTGLNDMKVSMFDLLLFPH
uniref:C-type lectin domain-containing protein n=1 Tax=Gopherus agassizii TaxID=38772 RepID=A0A452HAB7_9SAUR